MLVYRTIVRKFFWEFDSIIMQNLNNILPLEFSDLAAFSQIRQFR